MSRPWACPGMPSYWLGHSGASCLALGQTSQQASSPDQSHLHLQRKMHPQVEYLYLSIEIMMIIKCWGLSLMSLPVFSGFQRSAVLRSRLSGVPMGPKLEKGRAPWLWVGGDDGRLLGLDEWGDWLAGVEWSANTEQKFSILYHRIHLSHDCLSVGVAYSSSTRWQYSTEIIHNHKSWGKIINGRGFFFFTGQSYH